MMSFNASTLWDIARAYTTDNFFRSPLYDTLIGYIRSRNVKGICELDLPDAKLYAREFCDLRQLKAFFNKNAEFTDAETCSESAKLAFLQQEQLCGLVNKRFDDPSIQHVLKEDYDLYVAVVEAVRFIESVLDDPRKFLNKLPQLVKITGGATEDRPRKRSLPYLKVSRKLRTTSQAEPLLRTYLRYVGYSKEPHVTCVDANRIVFVPKNYKTYRTIACEPTAVLPFELAFDSFLKRNLQKVGCDLSDQTKNQFLARIGSLHNSFCTIDLSMASDSLSKSVVRFLLPVQWYNLLLKLRCTHYKGDVGSGKYEKWSSMGNGTTFSLESLIFLALVRASGSQEGTVYGDDLIIEPQYVDMLYRLLEFFGFRVNKAKSFCDGPFRESCGTDWLNGVLVTPFYVRQLPANKSELCHLINGLVLVSAPHGEVWKILKRLAKGLPRVPASEDTGSGIHIPYDAARSEGLLVSDTKKYGPWVTCCKQYVARDRTFNSDGIQAYLIWLLFGKKRVGGYVRFVRGKLVVDERTSLTRWSSGISSRKLSFARVEPWPQSSDILLLWAEHIKPTA